MDCRTYRDIFTETVTSIQGLLSVLALYPDFPLDSKSVNNRLSTISALVVEGKLGEARLHLSAAWVELDKVKTFDARDGMSRTLITSAISLFNMLRQNGIDRISKTCRAYRRASSHIRRLRAQNAKRVTRRLVNYADSGDECDLDYPEPSDEQMALINERIMLEQELKESEGKWKYANDRYTAAGPRPGAWAGPMSSPVTQPVSIPDSPVESEEEEYTKSDYEYDDYGNASC